MSRYSQLVCWKSIGFILHRHPASSLDDSRVILSAQLREIAWVGMKSKRFDSIRIKSFLPFLKFSFGVMEDSHFVGCYAASLGEWFATFGRKLSLSSSIIQESFRMPKQVQ
jgi:hypothetical protein